MNVSEPGELTKMFSGNVVRYSSSEDYLRIAQLSRVVSFVCRWRIVDKRLETCKSEYSRGNVHVGN